MSTPFAALEARTNSVVLKRLADALATVGGTDVPVLFEKPSADPFAGAADIVAPECTGAVEHLGGFGRGDAIVIDGSTYEVMSAEPDGAGFIRLVLGGS